MVGRARRVPPFRVLMTRWRDFLGSRQGLMLTGTIALADASVFVFSSARPSFIQAISFGLGIGVTNALCVRAMNQILARNDRDGSVSRIFKLCFVAVIGVGLITGSLLIIFLAGGQGEGRGAANNLPAQMKSGPALWPNSLCLSFFIAYVITSPLGLYFGWAFDV